MWSVTAHKPAVTCHCPVFPPSEPGAKCLFLFTTCPGPYFRHQIRSSTHPDNICVIWSLSDDIQILLRNKPAAKLVHLTRICCDTLELFLFVVITRWPTDLSTGWRHLWVNDDILWQEWGPGCKNKQWLMLMLFSLLCTNTLSLVQVQPTGLCFSEGHSLRFCVVFLLEAAPKLRHRQPTRPPGLVMVMTRTGKIANVCVDVKTIFQLLSHSYTILLFVTIHGLKI